MEKMPFIPCRIVVVMLINTSPTGREYAVWRESGLAQPIKEEERGQAGSVHKHPMRSQNPENHRLGRHTYTDISEPAL